MPLDDTQHSATRNGLRRSALALSVVASQPIEGDDAPLPFIPETAGRRKVELLTTAMCAARPPRRQIVKKVIGKGDHVEVVGPPGCGKSVLLPSIALAIATGRQALGRRTKRGRVLYIAAEDPVGLQARVAALHVQSSIPAWVPFRVLPAPGWNLFGEPSDELDAVCSIVDGLQPSIVVVDTLSAAAPGLRENDSDSMDQVVRAIRRMTEIGPAVLVAHHVTKDGGTSPRGHGRLVGDADVVLTVEGSGLGPRTVKTTKNRNGPCDLDYSFEIESFPLGIDEDGDPVTAPVLREVANSVEHGTVAKVPKAAEAIHRSVLEALCEAATTSETTFDAVFAHGARVGLLETIHEDDTRREADRKRALLRKHLMTLKVAGWVGIDGKIIRDIKGLRGVRR